jgi:enamine deaminase RidA (YjgF/YER057c/UK114 family)
MSSKVETSTRWRRSGHRVKSQKSDCFGQYIKIGAVAGVDPASGELASPDIESQTMQIIDAFKIMLESHLDQIININVVLADMRTSPA